MGRVKAVILLAGSLTAVLFQASAIRAQVEIGDFTIRGSIEADGLPRHRSGGLSKLEEYRDIPESVVVPQLDLFLDSKKQDFYLEFGSIKPGLNDQSYRLRAGRHGLLDLEFVWDQIPHLFNV